MARPSQTPATQGSKLLLTVILVAEIVKPVKVVPPGPAAIRKVRRVEREVGGAHFVDDGEILFAKLFNKPNEDRLVFFPPDIASSLLAKVSEAQARAHRCGGGNFAVPYCRQILKSPQIAEMLN